MKFNIFLYMGTSHWYFVNYPWSLVMCLLGFNFKKGLVELSIVSTLTLTAQFKCLQMVRSLWGWRRPWSPRRGCWIERWDTALQNQAGSCLQALCATLRGFYPLRGNGESLKGFKLRNDNQIYTLQLGEGWRKLWFGGRFTRLKARNWVRQ